MQLIFLFFFIALTLSCSKSFVYLEINNPTADTYSEEDISFTVDTREWECNGRNLFFLESNKENHLKYWFESTCGDSEFTRIWVKIPQILPFSTEQLKMYFDLGETEVYTMEEAFNQKFITMSTGEVCDEKTENADFLNGTFIRGAPSGTINLTLMKQVNNAAHDSISGTTELVTEIQSDNYRSTNSGSDKDFSTLDHFHNYEVTFQDAEPPKFRNTLFCSMEKIDSFKEKVAIQITDEQNSCYTNFDEVEDKFPFSMFEDIGMTGGNDEHAHEYSVTLSSDQHSGPYVRLYPVGTSYGIYGCYSSHFHYFSSTQYTDTVESIPEFVKVNLLKQQCENELEENFRLGLRYLATGIPPLGFEHDDTFAERFFRSTNEGAIGSIGGNALLGDHQHSFNSSTDRSHQCGAKLWATGSLIDMLSREHTHQISGKSSVSNSHNFPYMDLFMLKEKQNGLEVTVTEYDRYTELEELRDEYIDIVDEIEQRFTNKTNDIEEEIAKLEVNITIIEEELTEIGKEIETIEEGLITLKDELEDEIEEVNRNCTTMIDDLENSVDEMKDSHQLQLTQLNSRVQYLEQNDYSKTAIENSKDIDSLELRIQTENDIIKSTIESNITNLKGEMENEIDMLKQEIEDLKTLITTLQEQNAEADNKIESISSSSQGIAISGSILFILLIIGFIFILLLGIGIVIGLISLSKFSKQKIENKNNPKIEIEQKKDIELKEEKKEKI